MANDEVWVSLHEGHEFKADSHKTVVFRKRNSKQKQDKCSEKKQR